MDAQFKKYLFIRVLENAYKFKGKANSKAVLGKILSDKPELKNSIQELMKIIQETIEKVNAMTPEEQIKELENISSKSLEKKKVQEEKKLPDLPNINNYEKIIMRLAPYPSGPLHIGNTRMVILNDEYVKRYNGTLYLVYDDTIGSEQKIILPAAYDYIKEDLDWLGIKINNIFYKSDRLNLFYEWCKKLLDLNKAYVCTCDAEVWREQFKLKKNSCPCRDLGVTENLERWDRMLSGFYNEGEAVVRLKTGMDLDDPALRDHVIMRISKRIHPRVGDKYIIWPLLEFSWAIDDYELSISHILRGKDLIKEDKMEQIIWNLLSLPSREFIHYGRIRFEGLSLSKSKSARYVREKKYFGWQDPRTWSLCSLKARGFEPQAIREAILDLGLSLVDIEYSPNILYSFNRKIIDPIAERLFFVGKSIRLKVNQIDKKILEARPPKHPDFPEKGFREINLNTSKNNSVQVLISENDAKLLKIGEKIRLKDLINIKLNSISDFIGANYISTTIEDARAADINKIIHWVPKGNNINFTVIMPDGKKINGFAEPSAADFEIGDIVQFERFGFVRIHDKIREKNELKLIGFYAHK
jgi:glutamyl-tRNA synthetase